MTTKAEPTKTFRCRKDLDEVVTVHRSIVDVPTGEVATTQAGVLSVGALGSCIAVLALDAHLMVGGIAHVMQPGAALPSECERATRYAQNGILVLIRRLKDLGSRKEWLTICLVGGGNVLRRKDDSICSSNIESVMRVLSRQGLQAAASHLGGDLRRSCRLDAAAGRVIYTVGDSTPRVLWEKEPTNG